MCSNPFLWIRNGILTEKKKERKGKRKSIVCISENVMDEMCICVHERDSAREERKERKTKRNKKRGRNGKRERRRKSVRL